MVKSLMDFFDVVFPLNIGPLTYGWPSDRGPIFPGMLVRAPVKKNVQHGIVLRRATSPPTRSIKEILDIVLDKPIISDSLLHLLKWMADYYLVTEGLALKSILPVAAFEKTSSNKHKESFKSYKSSFIAHPVDRTIVSIIRESIPKKEYETYLLQPPTLMHEISYILDIINGISNVVILVPEMAYIEEVSSALRELVGERLTILHGKLSRAQKRNAFQRIISGDSDIVLGTRLAVFAPLKSLSLMAVLQEQNRSYKNLEGLRYHGRDAAVMRGYIEKTTVVLSSPCPSLESFYNTTIGKYFLLKPDTKIRRPKVEVINMKTARKITPHLSKRAIDAEAACIKRKENALFLVNRKGYSIIQCVECNYIETCPECSIPLVYHKDKKFLKCHYCGHTLDLAETCKRCKGSHFEMIGAGTQRIAAEIEKHLNTKPLLLDKDVLKDNSVLKGLNDIALGEEMIVGTKVIMRRLSHKESFNLCVFLNPDMNLLFPDFRAAELLFQEIFGISEYIKPDGLLLIQTKIPENYIFKYIKTNNLQGFLREELSMRRSLSYPPFSKMILITFTSRADVENGLKNALTLNEERVEIIGPAKTIKRGTKVWKLLLKSPSRERLHGYAKNILKNLKKEKRLKIVADVDPISI